MINLNFSTVEKLIFEDQSVQSILPNSMFNYFEQWRMAKRLPFMREIGKAAILDLLNDLGEDEINNLEQYFGERILVEKLNYSIALNLKIPLSGDVCKELCSIDGFNYLSTWRDDSFLYITLWR